MSLTRLMRFLVMTAMLLAPMSMMGGHAAMALPAPAATAMESHMRAGAPAGHCADMDQDQDRQADPGIDCMIACSAIRTNDFEVETHPMTAASMEPSRLTSALHGLHPESDPPPPRLS